MKHMHEIFAKVGIMLSLGAVRPAPIHYANRCDLKQVNGFKTNY